MTMTPNAAQGQARSIIEDTLWESSEIGHYLAELMSHRVLKALDKAGLCVVSKKPSDETIRAMKSECCTMDSEDAEDVYRAAINPPTRTEGKGEG
jgi:hypothetical protein